MAGRRFFAAAGSLNPGSPRVHGAGRIAPAETPGGPARKIGAAS